MLKSSKNYSYYYGTLSKTERRIYKYLKEELRKRNKRIAVNNAKTNSVRRAMRAVINDCPDYMYAINSYSYIDSNPVVIIPNYQENTWQFFSSSEMVYKAARRYAAAVTAKDDYGKCRQAHDIIANAITYKNNGKKSCHDINGPALTGKGVCSGIAKLYKYTMDLLRVPCIYLDNTDHAWNMVKVNGKWRHVDVTFDLNQGYGSGYKYFMLTDEQIYSDSGRPKPNNIYILPKAI